VAKMGMELRRREKCASAREGACGGRPRGGRGGVAAHGGEQAAVSAPSTPGRGGGGGGRRRGEERGAELEERWGGGVWVGAAWSLGLRMRK
jgi:hypothetical protein